MAFPQSSKRRPNRKSPGVLWTPAAARPSAKGRTLVLTPAGKVTVRPRTGLKVGSPRLLE